MKKILFVDDEQKVLDGLRRMLRGQRREWEMTFVDGGPAALDAMDREPFDVLVSDMRMPGMDGAALLAEAQERHPSTVRIILSGHAEMEAALRAAGVAHQFLSKPCDSEVIRSVVTRACDLQNLLDDQRLQETLGKIDSLPAIPRVYHQLTSALVDPEVSLEQIADIVEQDIAITAKILQLVNSSFFGIAKSVEGIRQATAYLGMNMITNLALSVEVFKVFEGGGPPRAFSMEREQAHASLTARIARKLLDEKAQCEQAFLAAMLHDVGKLILALNLPDHFARIAREGEGSERPGQELEHEAVGTTHAEIGAYLLGIWGMPYPVIEAVAFHHGPSRVEHDSFGILGAVHVANALANEMTARLAGEPLPTSATLDTDYLASVGVLERLDEWRRLAAGEAGLDEDALAA